MATENTEVEIVSLQPYQELRFIITKVGDAATVELTDGIACCFGWILPLHTPLTFRNQPFAITTQTGCALKVSGTFVSYYSATFEDFRIVKDVLQSPLPPTIFVIGAPSVGKTSICKWLCNSILASGQGKVPIYVNADPDQAPFCPPGCISAIPVTTPINNLGFPFTDPIMFFYGATKVEEKRSPLYIGQFEELMGHIVERRKFVGQSDGGVVIDFPSITSKCILGILEKFLADLEDGPSKKLGAISVLVVGDDRLYNSIRRSMPAIPATKMPMLSGAITLSKEARVALRSNETRRYFYGDGNPELLPNTYFLSKHDKTALYSLGNLSVLADSLLPISFEVPDPKVVHPVSFGERLVGCILAIVPQENKSILWKQIVIGFLHVIELGENETQLNVLKPNADPLPSNTLIVSQVKWVPQ